MATTSSIWLGEIQAPLRNNLELLLIGPTPPPTGLNNAEPFKLSTALIAVHKDCYTALNQIRQGGLHRRKTLRTARG